MSTKLCVHSRGTQISHIFFDNIAHKWTLQSLKDPKKYVQTQKFPLGASAWTTGDENALCGLANRTTVELTMSLCYPEKYTCNSGSCIPLRLVKANFYNFSLLIGRFIHLGCIYLKFLLIIPTFCF